MVLQRDVYDGFDRLTTLRTNLPGPGGQDQTNYTYDPLDRTTNRIEHVGTTSQKNTALAYLGLSDQIVDEQVSGQVQKTYQSTPWGELLSQTKHNSDGTTEDAFYGYDPHSSVEALTDTAGDTKATYGYTAYGQNDTQSFTGVDKPDPQDPTKEPYNFYRYTAKRFDSASGRYDLGFRDYDPGLNRFLTRDLYNGALADLNLSTDPFTNNRYTFAAGNPISMVDLTGHTPSPDNPVSANPELNKWLTTKWEAPKRYDRRKAQTDFNDWFYETYRINRPNGEWNPFCTYDWALCNYAAGKVLRGEWTGQQGLDYFEQTLRARSRNEQAFDEFLNMLGSTPPTAEIGAVGAIRGAAGISDDVLKATRELEAAKAASIIARFDADFALGQLTSRGRATASQLVAFGESQGWRRVQSLGGPITYVDENGIPRLTIKKGSPRTPGSEGPHVEVRNASGQRVDPYGNLVTRKSPGNHTPIEWDLP